MPIWVRGAGLGFTQRRGRLNTSRRHPEWSMAGKPTIPKSTTMDIQIATLCDFAADYNGKLVISGTFDTLAARALPVVHPACALALRFCFTPEDAGRHKLSINIINEDGESLDPNNMPIQPEFDVQLPKGMPFLTRNIVMNLQGLRFPEDGIYSIDIGCDDEVLIRLPLRVVKVNAEGKPE